MFDALYPTGLQWYWRTDFVRELSDKAIAEHIKLGNIFPTMRSSMHKNKYDPNNLFRVNQNIKPTLKR
jgi:hypothetical protein